MFPGTLECILFPVFVKMLFLYQNFSTYLCKLLFQLQMLGYDISWAAFNVIEVMSSSKFTFKVSEE